MDNLDNEEKIYIEELKKDNKFITYNNYWNMIGESIKKLSSFDPYNITYNFEGITDKIIVNGKILNISSEKSFKDIFFKTRQYAGCKFSDYDAVVELGSGWGRNLFIYLTEYDLSNIDIYSGEFTESGIEIQKYIKDKFFYESNLNIFHFDFNNSDIFFKRLNQKKYNKILFLTFWSIEQITYLNDKIFNNILNSADNVTCIHIEPIGWQITNNSIMKENNNGSRSYYNKNLYKKLTELVNLNKISISNVILDMFNPSPDPQSCGTLIEWKKK